MAKCFVGDLAFDVTDGAERAFSRVARSPGWSATVCAAVWLRLTLPDPQRLWRAASVSSAKCGRFVAARDTAGAARLGADARPRGRGLQATVCKGTSKGKDKETSKGYGFVVFSDEVSAELACTVGKQSGQRIWRVRKQNTPGSAALRAAGTEATPRAAPRLHAHRPLCARAPRYARGSTCAWALH